MLLDDTEEYDLVWNKVHEKLKFRPSGSYRGDSMTSDLPFEIEGNFAVYGIKKMSDSQNNSMQDMIREVFVAVTEKGRRMYALDWQHSAFIDEFFEYGYLGHPWRQEIWVFGDNLIEKMDEIYQALGWEKIR